MCDREGELKEVEPIEGIDFGVLSAGDVAMMRRGMVTGAEEVDFSEFYIDEPEDT